MPFGAPFKGGARFWDAPTPSLTKLTIVPSGCASSGGFASGAGFVSFVSGEVWGVSLRCRPARGLGASGSAGGNVTKIARNDALLAGRQNLPRFGRFAHHAPRAFR